MDKTTKLDMCKYIAKELYRGDISIPTEDDTGPKRWYNDMGELHRVGKPAMIYKNGSEYWLQNNKYHRTDGPAIIVRPSGTKYWFINGKQIDPIPNIIIKLRKKLNGK